MVKLLRGKLLLLAIVLSLLGLIPLLKPGLPPTHDGEYHVIRFYEFHKALMDGSLYPRWAPDLNHGFGVPLFNYVYPFPNYAAVLLKLLGVSYIEAFKLNLLIATLAGVIFFYKWSEIFWGDSGGMVAAVAYAFTPYRFVDIYVRGSVGEVWALAFFPAILWSVTKMSKKNNFTYILLSGVFFALLIFSHNILAVMFALFLLTYCLLLFSQNRKDITFLRSAAISAFIGISISAVFWLPALFEKKYVRGLEVYNITDNFAEIYQLIIPSWGAGFSSGDIQNQMSLQIGIIPLLVIILCTIRLISKIRKNKFSEKLALFFIIWFYLSVFFMLKNSLPLWNTIPLFRYFQFPWRFLSLTMVITSFLAGYVINHHISGVKKYSGPLILIVLFIVASIQYTKPAYYHQRDDEYYISRSNFIYGTNSPGDMFNTVWVNKLPLMSADINFKHGSGEYLNLVNKTGYKKYIIDAVGESRINTKIAYFPGWTVFQDGKRISSHPDENGLLEFKLDKYRHVIDIIFMDTVIRSAAKLWSICTISVVLGYLIIRQYKKAKI